MKVTLTDENWLQIVTFLEQKQISIESVSERFGVTRLEIQQHIQLFKELDPCVTTKSFPGAMTLDQVNVTWLTNVEFNLLGVKIVGRGVKNVGRVLLSHPVSLEQDGRSGEIYAVSDAVHLLYPIPEVVLCELWRLRASRGERVLRIGDERYFELLMKRLAHLKIDRDGNWIETDLKRHKQDLIELRAHELNTEERIERREVLICISDGKIIY